ncbi:hypothetical protein WJX72_009682 [[Myrmecia] bisecta]|uniref:ABC1 atypical kinase-like domain-containing protein n=1 Tax=[Myrmecia] bisecta TaxID=41462 RepID=A0AAW1QA10_9CHLO
MLRLLAARTGRRQQDDIALSILSRSRASHASGVHLGNSFYINASGKRIVLLGVPLIATQLWHTDNSLCFSTLEDNAPYTEYIRQVEASQPQHKLFGRFFDAVHEEVRTALRGCYLLLLFLPAIITLPFCVTLDRGRQQWVDLVVWTLERAGPAFIKWGQWAATRPDLFPPDLCTALAKLHAGAPRHSFAFTRHVVERAFRRPLGDIFEEFDEAPVASGSIAQIHRGVLSTRGASGSCFAPGTRVAVKVRHPGVSTMMQRDFLLMARAARLSARLPGLADLRLEDSVAQFGAPLKEQLDLQQEARHLDRFNRNFRKWRHLSFPKPIHPLVAPDVLVETFEEGRLISNYVNNPGHRHSAALANLGLDCYLKMLLTDNFVHADLHPGNIMVRMQDPNTLWGRVSTFLHWDTKPQLVLLDVGMVAELTRQDQMNLVSFFKAITSKDGHALAQNILGFSENQTCPQPEAFVQDMTHLFDGLDLDTISEKTSEIIGDMMEKIRQHQVSLKGVVSTVVVTTMVLEGWSTKLNPDIKIMNALKEILPMSWKDYILREMETWLAKDAASI